jgi:DNA-binding beta-propeller fold protein YncE
VPRSVALAVAVVLLAAAPARAGLQPSILGADPPVGHGVLRFPQALAFSPGGSQIWVADQHSSVVQEFTRDGTWLKDVGGHADARQLGRIGTVGGLAVDRSGHLYVLDSENDRVQVFETQDGSWLGAWGSRGTRPGTFRLGNNTGAGGIGLLQASGTDPVVAYVADQDNHRVQRFTLTGFLPAGPRDPAQPGVVPVPAPDRVWGHHGDCSQTTCDASFDDALNFPQGVTVDPVADGQGRHRVFVADDDNHRIVVYDRDGTFLAQIGSLGQGPGQFRFPYDVGVDARSPRRLYVADNTNHRVQAFDAATLAFDRTWGAFGPGPGQLEFPRALAAVADDPQGGVYVTDTAGNRVEGFDPDGNLVATFGVAGRGPGYVTDPGGVAVDPGGRVYVADTLDHRIELLEPDGSYAGQWGYVAAASGFAAPNIGAGQFSSPAAVAYDALTGHLWVADTGNHRVQELDRDGTALAIYGGPGAGSDPGSFNAPRGIAAGPDGAIYVADTGNDRVQRRDPATGAWSVVDAGTALSAPSGLAVDAGRSLLVGDRGRVVRIAGGTPSTLPAPPGGALVAPDGLALAGDRLYVTDAGTGRLLRFDLGTGAWEVLGERGRALGAFVQPEGVAVAPGADRIYVADAGNDRVQRLVDPDAPPPAAPAAPAPAPVVATAPARRVDHRRPVLSLLRVLPRAFRATRAPSGRGGHGARLAFTVSERARVRLTVVRVAGGRERRVGALPAVTAARGRLAVRLTGRLHGRAVRPGHYRVVLVATDPAGNRSVARRVGFTIRRAG